MTHNFEHFSEKELDILKARARRIADVAMDDQNGNSVLALAVRIGGEHYALPINSLKAVYENVPVIPVPCVPSYIAGIANIRGHIIPALDLRALLNTADTEAEQTRLVVATNDTLTAALQVEVVDDVINIAVDEISPFPADSERANYLRGVLIDGAGLLNIDTILSDPLLVVDEKIG